MAITPEENDLITRVADGAPLGEMFRQHYWLPAWPSSRVEAGGAPVRVRLLGSNYVLFRAHDGRLGFFDEACPHRQVSLALARNEDNALRCIFHGWKFGVDGTVLEVPNVAVRQEAFCKAVRFNHYRTEERGGIAWVWLGRGDEPPKFPDFPFTSLPENQRSVTLQTVPVNWLQGVEATMDSSHVSHLHQSQVQTRGMKDQQNMIVNRSPRLEYELMPYGFRSAALRELPDGRLYARVNNFVMPWYGVICAPMEQGPSTVFMSVPVDDVTYCAWFVHFNMHRPLGMTHLSVSPDITAWPPLPPGGPEENWGQNRDIMKRGHFSGFPQHVATEDFAMFMSQGATVDRTKDQLCASDSEVVRVRQQLVRAVRDFQAGKPLADRAADYSRIHSIGAVVPSNTDWHALVA